MSEWGVRWTRAEIETLTYDTEDGVPRAATAAKLGRTLRAVRHYATMHDFYYPADKAGDAAIRERWLAILPRLKADLRHDLEMTRKM